MKRGVVITPRFKSTNNGLEFMGGLDPLTLRHYLMYWDFIDYPENNIIRIHPGKDFEFLKNSGVAKSTNVDFKFSGTATGEIFTTSQSLAFLSNTKHTDLKWEMAQPHATYTPPQGSHSSRSMLEVRLLRTIPVPKEDINIQDILDFKEKRNDHLVLLREHIDNLAESVANNQHPVEAEKEAIKKIEKEIGDLKRVLKESRIPSVKRSLNTIIETPSYKAANELAGWAADISPIPYSSLAIKAFGVTAGLVQAMPKIYSYDERIPSELKPYSYLAYSQRDL